MMHDLKPSSLLDALVYTAAYADVFDYPLTAAELQRYLIGVKASRSMVEDALSSGRVLSRTEPYYTLPGRERLAVLRRQREQNSLRLWPRAKRYARIIASIPFIRMLAVTGSLAVNNIELDADVDFLIVTAPRRLWLARASVLAVARLAALENLRLCPNYLISEQALVFPNQTLYAAHELVQMVPLFGLDFYWKICRLNAWWQDYLPNAYGLPPAASNSLQAPIHLQAELEKMLPPAMCDQVENWEMRRKIKRLSAEQSFSSESVFSADFCKGHDRRHAQRTEQRFEDRLRSFELEPQS